MVTRYTPHSPFIRSLTTSNMHKIGASLTSNNFQGVALPQPMKKRPEGPPPNTNSASPNDKYGK